MSDAIHRTLENDPLAEEFFSQPPPAPDTDTELEAWEPRPMSLGERRAMTATLAMLLFVAAVTGCFAAYAEFAMVTPAPIGSAGLPRVSQTQPEAKSSAPEPLPQPAQQPTLAAPSQPEQQPTLAAPSQPEQQPALAAPSQPEQQPTLTAPSQEANPPARVPSEEHAEALAPAPQPAALAVEQSRHSAKVADRAKRPVAPRAQPEKQSASGVSGVDALTKRAYAELNRGRAREASELASHAIRLDPASASAYIALGGARDALGDREGARAAFRDCVRQATDRLASACRTLAR